jgi:tyrosine-protein phosphatase YwqE
MPTAEVESSPATTENKQTTTEETNEWFSLKRFPKYEISILSSEVRDAETKEIVRTFQRRDRYILIKLEGDRKPYYIHKLMADQFLKHNEGSPVIDHIDRDRANNSLSNLRYTTASMNCLNKTSHCNVVYEYTNSLPEGAFKLQPWEGIDLRFEYYQAGDDVYVYNSASYRKLYKNERGYVKLATKTSNKTKYKRFYP